MSTPVTLAAMLSEPDPLLRQRLGRSEPLLWLNSALAPAAEALARQSVTWDDMQGVAAAFAGWRPVLRQFFPELTAAGIESALEPLPDSASVLGHAPRGGIWLKRDDALPVVGSIKARGGCFEVLRFAEDLARRHGLATGEDALGSPAAQALFGGYTVAVGSTGNLGLSIGTMAAALGFRAVVHMSRYAKAWKKARLRQAGAEVVEHAGDYAAAVDAGRRLAAENETTYFVDDENSLPLFLGYAAATLRLAEQLAEAGVVVDTDHPLFVHLPCGVGGAPGGITFGLKHVFGDAVHCFFAEPTAAPCMLARMAFGAGVSIYDLGLDTHGGRRAGGAAGLRAGLGDYASPDLRRLHRARRAAVPLPGAGRRSGRTAPRTFGCGRLCGAGLDRGEPDRAALSRPPWWTMISVRTICSGAPAGRWFRTAEHAANLARGGRGDAPRDEATETPG